MTNGKNINAGQIEDTFNNLVEKERLNIVPEDKKKNQLEQTLLVSLKRAVLNYYQDPDYENIKVSDFKYEKASDDNFTYYVQYKNYYAYFSFSISPELYLTYPLKYKIVQNDESKKSKKQEQKQEQKQNSKQEKNK
ncbi:MAG: hypothetical protein OEZ22_09595 [Spirochaetia bacterium]|nr:hypothetical protein [Spirochaetia bacterium]